MPQHNARKLHTSDLPNRNQPSRGYIIYHVQRCERQADPILSVLSAKRIVLNLD